MIDTNAELISKALDKFEREKKADEAAGQKFLENDVHYGSSQLEVNDFLEGTRLKTIEFIQIGDVTIEAWYHSPLPQEYHCKILYTCPFCLTFFNRKTLLEQHSTRCTVRCPPGDEIYRDEAVSVFEFDAKQ